MVITIRDTVGIVLVDFRERGVTITVLRTLKQRFRWARKETRMFSLEHDSVKPHTSRAAKD